MFLKEVLLCAVVWTQNAEVGDLPVEPVKAAVNVEVEARSEETPPIFISADTPAPEPAGDVIYIELQPPVTKDSTPPPYKPNEEPTSP